MTQRWLLLLLCLMTLSVHAESLRPNSGLWWEEPVTGRFYSVEIAPSGQTFVVISEFDEHGKPVWRSMRGTLVTTSAQEQAAGAALATLTAPLTEIDGACPTCPVSAPNVRPSALGSATIVFHSEDQAEFQQGALRRPLRYFTPADQPADFPSARLRGDYVLGSRRANDVLTRSVSLQPAQDAACVRHQGTQPAVGATRLRASCLGGLCDGDQLGKLIANLELAVGPGEHPDVVAYQRSLAPEAIVQETCTLVFITTTCRCPSGFSSGPNPSNPLSRVCVRDDRPMVCTQSHRVSEQAGVLRGLPLNADEPAIVLYPAPQ